MENIYNKLRIVHLMMLGLQILIFGFFYFSTETKTFDYNALSDPLSLIAPIVAVVLIVVANMLFKNRMATLKNETDESIMARNYNSAHVIRWAFIEMGTFVLLFAFFYSNNLIFMIYAILVITYFYVTKPTLDGLKSA